MATTIKITEDEPEEWPEAPSGLSTAASALDPVIIWRRIEAYVSRRWAERAVTFIVEDAGQWEPPLSPVTITKAEIWRGGAWEELVLPAAPLGGFFLSGCGPHRFTGTAGGDDVPPSGKEAFRRLAEYMAGKAGKPGVESESVTAGSVSITTRRSPAWVAQAMQNSGAADLLRYYRRA